MKYISKNMFRELLFGNICQENGGYAFQKFQKMSNFQILRYDNIIFVKDDSIFVLYFLSHFGNSWEVYGSRF